MPRAAWDGFLKEGIFHGAFCVAPAASWPSVRHNFFSFFSFGLLAMLLEFCRLLPAAWSVVWALGMHCGFDFEVEE